MDNLNSIPLPPTSTIPLPLDSEPKLVITSSTSGERFVSTVSADAEAVSGDAEENGAKSSHKEKKKHKKEKHKHKHKHKEKSKDKKKSHQLITPEVLSQHASAIKAAMLKEVQSDSKDGDLSQTIVDDLFKDFLATKMNEIESAYKQAAEKKDSENEVINSVDEMNRLLDDELYSINQNTPSPVKKSAHSKRSHDKKSVKSDSLACEVKSSITSVQANLPDKLPYTESSKTLDKTISHQKKLSILESSEPSDDSLSSAIKQVKSVDVTITENQIKGKVQDHVIKLPAKDLSQEKNPVFDQVDCSVMKETSERKEEGPSLEPGKVVPKPGKFQLAFKISQTSADLISAGAKKDETQLASLKKNLEEGEVISSGHGSSSDSDSDEKEDVEDAEDDDADISETGSLSDSDKETKDKSKKKKKKKKHKKKKKKHKIAKEKDKDLTENKSKRKHSSQRSTSRSKSPKKHKKSQSPSKDTGKRSRSRSFSPRHGVWRDRSRSKDRKKKERSRSFSPSHGVWRTNKHRHERDRSRERETDRKHDHHHERDRERHRSRDRENEKRDSERRYGKWRSRSRSKERKGDKSKNNDDLRLKIDKAKLREIAMKNALAMAKAGSTVAGVDFASIKAGGKSINELTEFCARIASKEKLKHRPAGLTSSSSSDEGGKKSDDDEDSLIHHPFKVNEKSITLNIRNAVPLPILNAQEKITQQATLRLQFPVDSGNVHRTKELEWVPVQKTETVKTSVVAVTTNAVALPSTTPSGGTTTTTVTAVVPTVSTEVKLMPVKDEDRVFVETQVQEKPVDIRSIISERIKAARQLAENPKDLAAMSAMQKAQHNASLWASSKNLPGKFIGSTGAQILSQEELMGPDKKRQAWAKKAIADVTRYRRYRKKFATHVVKKLILKSLSIIEMKDQFHRAAPVKGGIGMALLQKMGWQQGTGLGKNNEGGLEPLALDFKMDRKGLQSQDEYRPSKKVYLNAPVKKDLSGKYPVSALVELCNKRRWGSPDFQMVHEGGPDHKKNFLFKVIVNGTEYQPSVASQNKKFAKAAAATAVLQEMGLVPRDS
ncbi:protein Son-like isoform X2 [Mytilus edulis]|uniref:protein Son-like isoform X2 n=1 Tax=Mytilus edulis TaxID=6550 RepID=UPI0039F01326